MTKQEVEVFAARLTRVWNPLKANCRLFLALGGFRYTGSFRDGVKLVVDDEDDELNFDLHKGPIFLMAKRNLGIINDSPDWLEEADREAYKSYAAEWMPFFRRGCWLSGCDIEATPDEKTEWMQGFSREELEAWNLKM